MTAGLGDAVHPATAASVITLLPTRPRLLALGEPTHGEEALLGLRNALFRRLVEHEGYRTIAIESDCLMGLGVDDYVRTGTDRLDEVLEHGFSHGWGAFPGNRALVRWMRAYNDGRQPAEQVRFAGFDGPLEITGAASPRPALLALHGYLGARVGAERLPGPVDRLDGLLGDDDRWPNPAAMWDPAQSVGRTPEVQELRLVTDDLLTLLDSESPHLLATSTPEEWQRARLYGRTAAGLLRYHAAMADPSPSRLARLMGLRDTMMAANLLALAERGPTLVSAHNGHLQRDRSSMSMGGERLEWWSAGAIVGAHLGAAYAVLAGALGTLRRHGVDTPPPDTVEGLLHALPEDRCLVDPQRLTKALGDTRPVARVSPYYGYAPLDPAQVTSYDGIVFVKDAAR